MTFLETLSLSLTATGWRVQLGDRSHSGLSWHEMLGQVVELTHPQLGVEKARFVMLTAEEWERRRGQSFYRKGAKE